MYKRAPIHGQTKGFRALCVPLKGILNICTKCSEWDIKFSHYNERAENNASAAEVATNSDEMSWCTFSKYRTRHIENGFIPVCPIDLFDSWKPAVRIDEVLKSTHSCIKFNWVPGYIRQNWLHIKSACTMLTRQIKLKHAFIFIDRELMLPIKMPALEFSKRCYTDSCWFLPGSCAFLNIVARSQL